ncbi:DEAD (Asp-Glu-Ala-Asp) box polypeptide 49 [Reticulomyxa filosa]|uniref:DEAD (Asp-Glu-Ala-Asp) box polypeptide 49 n=1 Tax=Reticulomyxa filosa TaxID=46433 RepID=X6N254_RETFI|nr:DEAD (Asp-Glu-Ala-Asp) box polypeptide 49 [Reticulomyxa filosa]|eukprot:ETO19362.1 DEAD (Asp-Glu-Ala-Asp) box polypeptide 49 [Reticulomyxa filosa]
MEFPVEDLKYLVIDEADELLGKKNYMPALQKIFQRLPPAQSRQTLLFSATLDESMTQIYTQALQHYKNKKDTIQDTKPRKPVFIDGSEFSLETATNVAQYYAFMPEMSKESYLVTLLKSEKFARKSVIVFVSTREYCQIMAGLLRKFGLPVSELHGNLKQLTRLQNLFAFRGGYKRVLICSDVASRGLDIPQVEMVINFDIPRTPLEYVHRIGRCGRVDRHGVSITFMSQYDITLLQDIERHIGITMRPFSLKRYEAECSQLMESVLIKRASVISKLQSRYLNDPEELRKHPLMRQKGKFTDLRITEGSDINKIKSEESRDRNNRATRDLDYLIEMKKKQMESTTEKEDQPVDGWVNDSLTETKKRLQIESSIEQQANIIDKYRQKLRHNDNNEWEVRDEDDSAKADNDTERSPKKEDNDLLLDFRDTDAKNLQFENEDKETIDNTAGKLVKNDEQPVGRDFRDMFGWKSFQYGKSKYLMKSVGRTARAITNNKKAQIQRFVREKKKKQMGYNFENTNENGNKEENVRDILSWNAPRLQTKQVQLKKLKQNKRMTMSAKNTKISSKPAAKLNRIFSAFPNRNKQTTHPAQNFFHFKKNSFLLRKKKKQNANKQKKRKKT